MPQVVTITLEDNGDAPYSGKGLSIPHGSVLQWIVPVGSVVCNLPFELFTNYPIHSDVPFDRSKYHCMNSAEYNGHSDWTVAQTISVSGCFSYYILSSGIAKCRVGHFFVDPVITINGSPITPETIAVQTVLPKCLGTFAKWEERLSFSASCGYNMVHFTPVQELGTSQSSYSIYDQLKLNTKLFGTQDDQQKWNLLSTLVNTLEKKYNMLSMTDLVWNHTADNSPWLTEHPEAGYNLHNSPHLKAAYEFDEALMNFSKSVEGVIIDDEAKLADIMQRLSSDVFPSAKLWEYCVIDVDSHVRQFREACTQAQATTATTQQSQHQFQPIHEFQTPLLETLRSGIYNDGSGDRFHTHVKLDIALSLFNAPISRSTEEITTKCQEYEKALSVLNVDLYRAYDETIKVAMQNMTERIRYEFVSSHGPKWGAVSERHPLLTSLFTRITVGGKIFPLANNGWIYNGNPLVDFAGPHSNAYFERSVIVWGDCVKLRYGTGPEESPWLWEHMANYTTKMAEIFHGFRIDNCHSTPIHVAQYLLDAARRKRENLYVACELFTGSEEIDAMYVSQLGITSLIREAMGANDSWELGRLCHRHGGNPVGSFLQRSPYPTRPKLPGALFMDCTHDNETPTQKRTTEDALPNAGIVAFAASAIGSVRGYDELIAKTIDVVHETREYPVLDPSRSHGIAYVKLLLNKLHQQLSLDGYREIHVHQEGNIITIQRHHPDSHEATYLVAHTAFSSDYSPSHGVRIPGRIRELAFIASLSNIRIPAKDAHFLLGIKAELHLEKGSEANKYLEITPSSGSEIYEQIKFHTFPPGSVLGLKVSLPEHSQTAIQHLQSMLQTGLADALSGLSLVDMNVLLYRAGVEEYALTGGGSYHLNNYGNIAYCGLQGFASVLTDIRDSNDLGHPMCNNLREGNWMMDYIVSRLRQRPSLASITSWLNNCFDQVKQLPRYLIPKYFSMVVLVATNAAENHAIQAMSTFVQNGSGFVKGLALTSVQLFGIVDSVLISQNSILPTVPDNSATLAAGLTHFATGYMRSWGRDTFISLKGLFLVTGRFTDARMLILAYAACVRHGLVPNLLDSGVRPRYNARDAVWWFLQAVQDYCTLAPEGNEFMATKVYRLFARDERGISTCTLAELIHEIMQRHALGISFREWEAGTAIDDRMQDQGFNINIQLDSTTGFLHGGNEFNCGTWMDKMGESSQAGNRGIPATPRVGAPVEITGLLKSTLRWLVSLHTVAPLLFPYEGVDLSTADHRRMSYAAWDSLIQANFDKHYYIPENPDDDSKLHRRGMYKDVLSSSPAHEWAAYQLRPNQCVAMAVAPELFPHQHATTALKIVEDVLIKGAPLGMRTLDPTDFQYCGDYTNTDGADYKTAGGFNYHCGPEWLWPLGYFLDAKLHFFKYQLPASEQSSGHMVHKFLRQHRTAIESSQYRGLPELTNTNGAHCSASCEVQAWSSASILSALHHLHLSQHQ